CTIWYRAAPAGRDARSTPCPRAGRSRQRGGRRDATARRDNRPGCRPAEDRSQRPVLVRQREEVQEVPRQRRIIESTRSTQSSQSPQSPLSTDSTEFGPGGLGRPALAVLSGLLLILSFPPF